MMPRGSQYDYQRPGAMSESVRRPVSVRSLCRGRQTEGFARRPSPGCTGGLYRQGHCSREAAAGGGVLAALGGGRIPQPVRSSTNLTRSARKPTANRRFDLTAGFSDIFWCSSLAAARPVDVHRSHSRVATRELTGEFPVGFERGCPGRRAPPTAPSLHRSMPSTAWQTKHGH